LATEHADAGNSIAVPPPLGIVHGLPAAEYHRGVGLSQSSLKYLRQSPWHYRSVIELPWPEWFVEDDDETRKVSQFAGTLCHCATLEPLAFDRRYVVGPDIDKRTKDWKDFVKANADRQVISARQYAVAHAQAAALRAVPDVADILDGGEFELSAYWIDKATGILCRARPDCLNRTFGTPDAPAIMLLDVKTTADARKAAVSKTIAHWGYHHQADWYCRGVAQATGLPVAGFVFAFVEQTYPFACSVFELDPEAYEVARRENRDALELLARCQRTNSWPGYPQACEYVSLPRWAGGSE
jgi:hypothetical protein